MVLGSGRECLSFMPWLVGTALLHSAIVVEKRDALKSWTILLAIIAFSLSACSAPSWSDRAC
ncbi:MAG: cytochrome c biogenesis protein CcsA [Thalassobaculum sp.]